MDSHDRLVADILTRYRTLLMLATIQAEGDRSSDKPEAIAVAGISLKMEFEGLYSSIKELLTLSRKMKELWVFGPLGRDDQGSRAMDEQIRQDVTQVAALLAGVEAKGMRELAEKSGGSWEPVRTDDGEGQQVQAQGQT
ncbi:hypothetical protein ACO1O0_001492 [Amphichorda felina]